MNKKEARLSSSDGARGSRSRPRTTPPDRGGSYFALATDLEAAIGSLPSVRGVRVVTDDQEIEEIHVLSEPAVQPKRLVRDIVTLLFVRFGMRIDHRRISIVGSEQQPSLSTARPILQSVQADTATRRMRAELRFGEQVFAGECPLDAGMSDIKAACAATLDAIGQLLGRQGELSAREASILSLGGEEIVIVLVHWQTNDVPSALVGTSLSEENQIVAAGRATLDAVNRRLIRLPQRGA